MKANLIAIDETRDWCDDIQTRAKGKIYTVYVYNPSEGVCCCEARPSYWLEPLYCFGSEPWDDDLYDDIQEGLALCSDGHYRHCSAVEASPAELSGTRLKYNQDGFDDWEDALDYYRGNAML